jgi:hypothetical protein
MLLYICFFLFLSVSFCFFLFLSVSFCFFLFLSVSFCFFMLLYVSLCFLMFLYVSLCFTFCHLQPCRLPTQSCQNRGQSTSRQLVTRRLVPSILPTVAQATQGISLLFLFYDVIVGLLLTPVICQTGAIYKAAADNASDLKFYFN